MTHIPQSHDAFWAWFLKSAKATPTRSFLRLLYAELRYERSGIPFPDITDVLDELILKIPEDEQGAMDIAIDRVKAAFGIDCGTMPILEAPPSGWGLAGAASRPSYGAQADDKGVRQGYPMLIV